MLLPVTSTARQLSTGNAKATKRLYNWICTPPRHRCFSSSNCRRTQESIKEEAENGRPAIYYHMQSDPAGNGQRWALSFLPEPPKGLGTTNSIIGYIPVTSTAHGPSLDDFQENESFKHLLHDAVKRALKECKDDIIASEAIVRGGGWLHINGKPLLVNMRGIVNSGASRRSTCDPRSGQD